jgi:hypothetical protein
MALARRHFEIVAVYLAASSPKLEMGPSAVDIVNRYEGISGQPSVG